MEFARTSQGLQSHANFAGANITEAAPQGYSQWTLPYTVGSNQVSPDPLVKYTVLAGATATGPGGNIIQTMHNIRVDPALENDFTTSYSLDGTRALSYATEKSVMSRAGEIRKVLVEIGTYTHFLKIKIPDSTATEILGAVDLEGREYYEVPNLAVNETLVPFIDRDPDTGAVSTRMIETPVPRRFQVLQEDGHKVLLFGYGSESGLTVDPEDKNSMTTPTRLVIDREGTKNIKSNVMLPEKHLTSDRYGVPPQNTTITIEYRSNTTENSNIPVGGIDTVLSAEIVFDNEELISQETKNFIRNNISVSNAEPFNGVVRYNSTTEMGIEIQAALGSQGRAVTERDFKAMAYRMPTSFGKIRKVSVNRDTVGLRRNINLYCISQGSDRKLQKASTLLKQNLKTWLNKAKMMSDTIDIFDAQILNLGLHLDLTLKDKKDINTAMPLIRSQLFEKINLVTPEIGQAFSLGEIERILHTIPLIQSVNAIQINIKNSSEHSTTRYDVSPNISPDFSMLYVPEDFIWEIKFPTDITGVLK